jgi:hypothetical protein
MKLSIQKKTGTYAETLEAVGTASLLSELGFGAVTIKDEGSQFQVRTSKELAPEQWSEHISPGYPYIWESSKEPEPAQQHIVDYESEKIKRDAARKAGKKSKAKLEAQEIEAAPEPVPELSTAAILASMRKGWKRRSRIGKVDRRKSHLDCRMDSLYARYRGQKAGRSAGNFKHADTQPDFGQRRQLLEN